MRQRVRQTLKASALTVKPDFEEARIKRRAGWGQSAIRAFLHRKPGEARIIAAGVRNSWAASDNNWRCSASA